MCVYSEQPTLVQHAHNLMATETLPAVGVGSFCALVIRLNPTVLQCSLYIVHVVIFLQPVVASTGGHITVHKWSLSLTGMPFTLYS